MSLVEHARRELELAEPDPWMREGLIKVVEVFAEMGHSGGSAAYAIPTLARLLSFQALSPLTDNPDEWMVVDGEEDRARTWQSRRQSDAFSTDGGKTYYVLSEEGRPLQFSQPHEQMED